MPSCCTLEALNNTPPVYSRLPPPLRASRKQLFSDYTESKEGFVRRKAERPPSFVTSSRIFWSFAKTVSRIFCPSDFSSLYDSSGDLVFEKCEKAEGFASRFASNPNLPNYPALTPSSFTNPLCLHTVSTRKTGQAPRSLNVCELPLGTVSHSSSLKYAPGLIPVFFPNFLSSQ